ncbi:uncharacterized protein BYT42DRAFT_98580 [Radiomyces spectabilis]|uniref:uncharacterized protein n=1 Tax=Radiomyces spectabilis TaxID=64574 RepID=UPI00221F61F7|nr:uncharacterized protein BYT42DRAFT_98580 [Radiomyces spectabilis]KAI8370678.1 hypothetical protein BYT42DRAFT_98580 [Radiomyces spectabilis]
MESRPKRQSAVDKDYRERKRSKKDEKTRTGSSSSTVHTQCKQLYKELQKLKDDSGDHLVTELFQQLPPRRQYPDYYEVIKQPIALNGIKIKLDQHEYSSLSQLKADIELMVSNAKKYNIKESQVYEDAVAIQKFTKAWSPTEDKSSPASGTEPKTVLKLPGGAFGRNVSTPPTENKIKSIRLRAVERQPKRVYYVQDLITAISKRDSKHALEILESEPSLDVNELDKVEMFNDQFTWGPLHAAAYYGDVKLCQALLARGADVELHDTWYSATPLGWAAYGDRDKVARLLIDQYKANKKAKNKVDQVPFDVVSDQDDPRWIGIFKGPYPPKSKTVSPEKAPSTSGSAVTTPGGKSVTPPEHKTMSQESPSPASDDRDASSFASTGTSVILPGQPGRKRRGRPPKSEVESLAAALKPVEEIDLEDFDPIAFMKELFHAVRIHTDNSGRLYSEIFEVLPDRNEYPDYYLAIKQPRSLSMIDERMRHQKYPTLRDWYRDMERVFENAMEYNEPGSRVYRDAKLLLRLLHRLKDRGLVKEGVPESQEADVMRLSLTDRPFDASGSSADERRRNKRGSSKPRMQSIEPDMMRPPRQYIQMGPMSVMAPPPMMMPTPLPPPNPPFPTEMMAPYVQPSPIAQAPIQEPMQEMRRSPMIIDQAHHRLPTASPAFYEFFQYGTNKLQLLSKVCIAANKTLDWTVNGDFTGHSLTLPSRVDTITICPFLSDTLRTHNQRVSIAILQNNCKLNMEAEPNDPPSWKSAPLLRGMNTFKINVTVNITMSETMAPEYRSQVYHLFITQTW